MTMRNCLLFENGNCCSWSVRCRLQCAVFHSAPPTRSRSHTLLFQRLLGTPYTCKMSSVFLLFPATGLAAISPALPVPQGYPRCCASSHGNALLWVTNPYRHPALSWEGRLGKQWSSRRLHPNHHHHPSGR